MAGIKIKGFGRSHGDRVVTNEDMTMTVDTSDQWIRSKTGIESRYFAEKMSNEDMAFAAAEQAVREAGITADELGILLVCTFTPDNATPSVACSVAGRLGTGSDILAVDINGACTGFIYGCAMANDMLAARHNDEGTAGDGKKYGLVIGSEKISPLMDMGDRGTCVLFGDGAGAVVLEYENDGAFSYYSGCSPDCEVLFCDRFDPAITMKGQEVYRFAVNKIEECTKRILAKSGTTLDDIDHYVCHQANERIIDSAARKLGLPLDRFFKNLQHYGNTSAASVPIALCEMHEKGLLKKGMNVICTGFGAGLTYGSMMIRI